MATATLQPTTTIMPFHGEPAKDLDEVSQAAFPDNPELYKQAILDSLKKHLRDDVNIEDLWAYLKGQFCSSKAIIKGLLQFFSEDPETKEKKVINLANFLKPLTLSAEADVDRQHLVKRLKAIEETKAQLTSLLQEIETAENKAGPSRRR